MNLHREVYITVHILNKLLRELKRFSIAILQRYLIILRNFSKYANTVCMGGYMQLIMDFDPFKILKKALKMGGDFADIYIEETVNTSIICEENKIEKVISGRDRGLGLRVIFDFKTAYAYTNDLTEKGLLELAETVSKAVKQGRAQKDISLVKKDISFC